MLIFLFGCNYPTYIIELYSVECFPASEMDVIIKTTYQQSQDDDMKKPDQTADDDLCSHCFGQG